MLDRILSLARMFQRDLNKMNLLIISFTFAKAVNENFQKRDYMKSAIILISESSLRFLKSYWVKNIRDEYESVWDMRVVSCEYRERNAIIYNFFFFFHDFTIFSFVSGRFYGDWVMEYMIDCIFSDVLVVSVCQKEKQDFQKRGIDDDGK